MYQLLGGLLVAMAALPVPTQSGGSWRGTVKIDGMIHEPSGYHPYVTTVSLHLREGDRVSVPGGFRVALINEGSVLEVKTEVYQTTGLMLCSGTGTETLSERSLGYLETKAGQTSYHLVIPRAFGAFACGRVTERPNPASEERLKTGHPRWRAEYL